MVAGVSHHVLACPTEVARPLVHQAAPTLEEITACVGRLGGVLYRMGERGLDHFAGCVRPFRGPVPEARPEPMRHGSDAEVLGQSWQRHGGEWLPAPTAEHETGAIAPCLYVVQDRERPDRERDAVIPLRLAMPLRPNACSARRSLIRRILSPVSSTRTRPAFTDRRLQG